VGSGAGDRGDAGGGERFGWPEGSVGADDSALGELPSGGPLAEFLEFATILSAPTIPGRPLVLAHGDRVVKAYDLRAFDGLDRRRARAEAETAVALSDIDGVVTTYRTGEVGHWLVIEMERLGETVADHLAVVAAGIETPLAPARWGELLEAVATSLQEIHRRRLIHRDVKPANLMFERDGDRLVLADFSISSKRRKDRDGAADQAADLAGTRRYIAPEVFQGRMGYAVDQYGLAVTAEDVLGGSASPSAREVLLRATEQDPEYRFASIADLGVALRAAIDDRAPRRLSSRLRRVSPRWRLGWGPGAAAFAGAYGVLLWLRVPSLPLTAGLFVPLLAAGLTALATRGLNRLRGGRTQPRIGLADRPWFPLLLFVVAFVAMGPIIADDPAKEDNVIFFSWLGSLVVTAFLGSMPRDAGEWLIRLVQGWESRRQARRDKPLRRWGGRLAGLVGSLAFIGLPAAVSARWPNETSAALASDYPQIVAVADSRAAMLADPGGACRFMRIPAGAGIVPCREWSPIAARWLRKETREQGSLRLVPADLDGIKVSFNDGSEKVGAPTWSVWTGSGRRLYIGTISRTDAAGKAWDVVVTRDLPQHDPLAFQQSFWEYEVVRRDGRWLITSIGICDVATQRGCTRISQTERADLPDVRRLRSPG
jgi:tRNA A-37 threonylcarbamoyl transferase component Bud32